MPFTFFLPHSSVTLKAWDLATGKYLRTFEGHSKTVSSVAITPDGSMAVSGSWDKTLKAWDLVTGECLRNFTGHTSYVHSVAITPDGAVAVSGSADMIIKVWKLPAGDTNWRPRDRLFPEDEIAL